MCLYCLWIAYGEYLFAVASTLSGGLLDIAKLALLGKEPVLLQPLLLLGGGVLLGTNNATPLVHHKLRNGQTTRCLVGGFVVDLGAGTEQLGILLSIDVVKSIRLANRFLHLVYYRGRKKGLPLSICKRSD